MWRAFSAGHRTGDVLPQRAPPQQHGQPAPGVQRGRADAYPNSYTEHMPTQATATDNNVQNSLLGLIILILAISLLPSAFIIWLCVGLVIAAFMRAPTQIRQLRSRVLSRRARVVRTQDEDAWVVFHRDNQPAALNMVNMQMSVVRAPHISNSSGYDMLLGSEQHTRPNELSDSDISSLPAYQFRSAQARNKHGSGNGQSDVDNVASSRALSAGAAAEEAVGASPLAGAAAGEAVGASPLAGAAVAVAESLEPSGQKFLRGLAARQAQSTQQQQQQQQHTQAMPHHHHPPLLPETTSAVNANLGEGSGATATTGHTGSDQPCPSSLSEEKGPSTESVAAAPDCTVCLDVFREGDHVMALPCMHQFHQACITPWLRRQGKRAVCPVCKTPCFA